MVFCLPFLLPLVLLPERSEQLSEPLVFCFIVFGILVHRPCVQCTLLFLLTLVSLCQAGLSQFCVLRWSEMRCSIAHPNEAALCLALA